MNYKHIDRYLSLWPEIIKHTAGIQVRSMSTSPAYVLPSLLDDKKSEIVWGDGYVAIQTDETYEGFGVLPTREMTPQEYFQILESVLTAKGALTYVQESYARVFEKRKHKTKCEAIEFLYETDHLVSILKGGRKYRELRRLRRRYGEEGITFSLVDIDYVPDMRRIYTKWKEEYKGGIVYREGYSESVFNLFYDHGIIDECRVEVLMAHSASEEPLAYAMGMLLSDDCWTCCYSYGLKSKPSLMTLCWLELAEYYADLLYENDGDAGEGCPPVSDSLWKNKVFFLKEKEEAFIIECVVMVFGI